MSGSLGNPSARTARAVLNEFNDPLATLRAWRDGPWADAGLPQHPWQQQSRQWLDIASGRAREETAGLVVICDGDSWWRGPLSGSTRDAHVQCAETLRLWTAPQALEELLDMSVLEDGDGPVRVSATPRNGDAFSVDLAPLGRGADRWELLVDPAFGAIVGSTAYIGDDIFKRVEALEIAFDEELSGRLFEPD